VRFKFGHQNANLAQHATGLAANVAWAYGLAAVVVEGPFTDAVYATETRKDE